MPSPSFLRLLRRWHRGTALFLLVWILFVALTGIALNHSASLGLDKQRLSSPLLLKLYGIDLAPPEGIAVGSHWLSAGGDQRLYVDSTAIGYCEELNGAEAIGQEIYAACGDALLVIDGEGQIIERLPSPPELASKGYRFGLCGVNPCAEADNTRLVLDPIQLSWQPTNAVLSARAAEPLPAGLAKELSDQSIPAEFSQERLVRDLHSGVIASLGPWLMDFFALALIFLSLTGIALWFTNRNGKQR